MAKKKKSGRGGGGGGKKKSNGGKKSAAADSKQDTDEMKTSASNDEANGANGNNGSERTNKNEREEEAKLIAELYTLSRSLLASLQGCAPDGTPLSTPTHPLAKLHQQLLDRVDMLRTMQFDRAPHNQEKSDANDNGEANVPVFTDRTNPDAWSSFEAWLTQCDISPTEQGFPVEIRPSVTCCSDDVTHETNDASSNTVEYGLFATRDISYGEVVLKIPIETMMCPYFEHIQETKRSSSGSGNNEHEDDPVVTCAPPPPPFDPTRPPAQDAPLRPLCLVTYLANERYRGNRSIFAQYLDTLPESAPTPLYWNLNEIRRLKRTAHLKRAVMMQAKLVWDYIQAREIIDQTHQERKSKSSRSASNMGDEEDLIPTRDFTYELFRWATVTAHTRQNLIPFPVATSRLRSARAHAGSDGDEAEKVEQAHALCPLWDLLNHEDSDRACLTDVVFESDDAGKPTCGVLVCQTPPDAPKGNVPCFHKNEEITMYYGKRSNAQLLYHSGFVNCAADAADGQDKYDGNDVARRPRFNMNRSDCAIIRVALPPAEQDRGLDRIREMIAPRVSFVGYADQGCRHDGMACAEAAGEMLEGIQNATDNEEKKPSGEPRKATEVVMAEFAVSTYDVLPDGLLEALLLCVADKDELTHLLRNMDKYLGRYMKPPGEAEEDVSSDLLQLGEKHLELAAKLVQVQCDRCKESALAATEATSTEETARLASSLALCDDETLRSWLDALRSNVLAPSS